jgi:hypothetical protein
MANRADREPDELVFRTGQVLSELFDLPHESFCFLNGGEQLALLPIEI